MGANSQLGGPFAEAVDGAGGFAGTDRFEVRQQLGAGANGVVYEAYDRKLDAIVALKALARVDPVHLYLFKQEFRELADVSHPHLVTLYELESGAGRWFFTMELVRGRDFLAHVRDEAPVAIAKREVHTSSDTVHESPAVLDAIATAIPVRPLDAAGIERLRGAMRQLAEGVAALHRARKLHRDLKPSNVRVDPSGRVVVLDFGLVLPLRSDGVGTSTQIAGTPAYMAPEQAAGLNVTEASDWYAVGVMLFQALTGWIPRQVSSALPRGGIPSGTDGLAPSRLVPGVPRDLDRLCAELLARDPSVRPRGDEVLARLGGETPSPTEPTSLDPPFVGRADELARLDAAYLVSRQGRAAVVGLAGPSGMGKSRLMGAFLERVVAQAPDAVVLTGRCYQQESVPFEALDSVVDALSRFLAMTDEPWAYIPADVTELGRVFPVLRQVKAIGDVPLRATMADQGELRRRAFAELRSILARISALHPLVVAIDDIQWGSDDAGALLAEILQPPHAPAMLVIGAYRAEEAETSPMLRRLSPELDRVAWSLYRDDISLDALSPSEARVLASSVLGGTGDDVFAKIAAEGEGSPFFVCELARHHGTTSVDTDDPRELSLGDVVVARVGRVLPAARRLLAVVAAAGRPFAQMLALRAAELSDDSAAAIAELRSRHLVRVRTDGRLETYHDRIRGGVIASLTPDALAATHRSIADVMEPAGEADPEILVHHLVHAGEHARAAPHAAEAARRASETLAFERAAQLYDLALSLDTWPDEARCELAVRCAEALANAGQGTRAGRAYLDAAALVRGEAAVDLRRRAAEQLLMSGRLGQGRDALGSVLASVGLAFPRTPIGALLSIVWHTLLLRLRGLAYRARTEGDVPRALLRRIDVCWAVCHGLAGVSPLHSMAFVTRGARLALRAGEPGRISTFLALHATLSSAVSPGSVDHEIVVAHEAAERSKDPYPRVLAGAARAACLYFAGDVRDCVGPFAEADRRFHECQGVAWEILTFQSLGNFARTLLGDWRSAKELVPGQVREAEQRGDLYGATMLALALGWVRHLAADDPGAALRELDEYLGRWTAEEMHYHHFYDAEARAYVHLYMGDPLGGLAYLDRRWSAFRAAGLLRVQVVHVMLLATRISCLIAASREAKADRRGLLSRAHRYIRTMRALRFRCAQSWGDHLLGCAALAEGERERAVETLARAGAQMREQGYKIGPICGDWLRGTVLGGDEGEALVAAAIEHFRAQGFRAPARFARLFAPC